MYLLHAGFKLFEKLLLFRNENAVINHYLEIPSLNYMKCISESDSVSSSLCIKIFEGMYMVVSVPLLNIAIHPLYVEPCIATVSTRQKRVFSICTNVCNERFPSTHSIISSSHIKPHLLPPPLIHGLRRQWATNVCPKHVSYHIQSCPQPIAKWFHHCPGMGKRCVWIPLAKISTRPTSWVSCEEQVFL